MNFLEQAFADLQKPYVPTTFIFNPVTCKAIREYYGWTENPPHIIESPSLPRDFT